MTKQFIKLAADLVIANSTGKGFSTDQLTQMLIEVSKTLKELSAGSGEILAVMRPLPESAPIQDWKASIGKNEITCMICGKSMKILTPHLKKHNITPREYRKQFEIPAQTPLASKAYRAKRSKIAKEAGLAEKLQQARKAKKAAV